jgi:hypothetical protein
MPGGRPLKPINQIEFEKLCGLQCTQEEICGWFGVCSDTLESWCKRTYDMNFSEVFKEKRGMGKISLRRAQFRLAEKNANMAIWLGKQYLGQSDRGEYTVAVDRREDDPLTLALKETARAIEQNEESNASTK